MKKYLEIYLKTWKNHENIMEFCQSEKVGTLNVIRKATLKKSKAKKGWMPKWTASMMDTMIYGPFSLNIHGMCKGVFILERKRHRFQSVCLYYSSSHKD